MNSKKKKVQENVPDRTDIISKQPHSERNTCAEISCVKNKQIYIHPPIIPKKLIQKMFFRGPTSNTNLWQLSRKQKPQTSISTSPTARTE